jgi:hypothetical protein
MKQLVAVAVLFVSLTAFVLQTKQHAKDRMQSFRWLLGDWIMKTNDGAITESWKEENKNRFNGQSDFLRKDGILQPFEVIQLVYRKKHYYYIAKAAGQNNEEPVEFKITAFSNRGFIAENPQHDFPKRITYRLINQDSIHAWVDDGAEKPVKKSDFYYTRKK